jgi:hypothetical protein
MLEVLVLILQLHMLSVALKLAMDTISTGNIETLTKADILLSLVFILWRLYE